MSHALTAVRAHERPLTLVLLLAVFAVNFMDRQIVAIVSEPIRLEFGLSDAQIGLLYGLAFAVVYSAAGIPIARWADRVNRAHIINGSLIVFSVMTMACGLAGSYAHLLAARIGVAMGEGGTNPSSHSLIADLYSEAQRGTAMAVFALGPNFGILLGFAFGGAIGQAWGWRSALLAAGAAGLALAVLTSWLLKDTARVRSPAPPSASLAECVRALFRHPAMRHLFLGGAVMSIAAYAAIAWLPAFLIRSHGMGMADAGLTLAILLGGVGGVGTLLGGWLADRLGARQRAWRLHVVAVALVGAAPFWPAAMLVADPRIALACLVVPAAALCVYLAPTFAAVQTLAEPRMRALAAAVLLLVGSLIGLGLGPVLVGALSDSLRQSHGADSLRVAMLAIVPLMLWSAGHYFLAGRALR
jgi:predicted MFS family arabinose efflux permease